MPSVSTRYVLLFMAGAVISGTLLGGLLGFLGLVGLFADMAAMLLVGGVFLVVTAHVLGVRLRAPSSQWMVPRHWQAVGRERWAFLFGFFLGFGFLTYVSTLTFYLLLLGSVAIGDPLVAALTLACFGATRAAPLAVTARCVRRRDMVGDPYGPVKCMTRLHRYRTPLIAIQSSVVAFLGVLSLQAILSGNAG